MKAYLSGASIPSAFVERDASNSETSRPFNIRRSAATNVCARRSRLCLPHISHACQSKFDLRAPCYAGITKNTDGNPRDSPRPTAVNKLDDGKKRYLRRKRDECAHEREVESLQRRIGMNPRRIESRITAKVNLCDSLAATIPSEIGLTSFR